MDNWIQNIGLLSAALTTTAFLPQVIKTWRTKSTHDLSPLMFTLFCFGISGWLIYGFLIHDLPMILANSVTILLAGTIMYFILRGGTSYRIVHIGIYVNNLEKMRDWYIEIFGAISGKQYHNPDNGFRSYFLTFPSGTKLELMHREKREAGTSIQSWGHIAISLNRRSKVDEFTQNMKKQGVEIVSTPRMTGDGYYECVIRDPEGNLVEITA